MGLCNEDFRSKRFAEANKENDNTNKRSDLELERERNMKEMNEFVFADDPEGLEKALLNIKEFKKSVDIGNTTSVQSVRKKKRSKDKSVIFHCQIPVEQRKSMRLAKLEPLQYNKLDFVNEEYEDDIQSLEKVIFRPKIRISSSRSSVSSPFIPVEEVSEDYLSKIAKSSTKKIYSQNGTSCHQCRQKTTDSKTVCRSGKCFGVRGQFCGPCLKNRYGEDAATALLDPQWACPCCRGRCNCSFCRKREGKRPTGILAPIAQKHGYKSVDEFLRNLNGIGDFENYEDSINDDDLLGFAKNGIPVLRVMKE